MIFGFLMERAANIMSFHFPNPNNVRFRKIKIANAVIPKIGESNAIPHLILEELFLEIEERVRITTLINIPKLENCQYESERFSLLNSKLKI